MSDAALQFLQSISGLSWCLCFGSLLSVHRTGRLPDDGDVDIGILADHQQAWDYLRNCGIPINNRVVSDATGAPIQASLSLPGGTVVDIYWWYRKDGNAYHCFDENHEHRPDGRLSSYHFKGIPEAVFYPTAADISSIPTKCFIERRIRAIDPAIVAWGDPRQGDGCYVMMAPGHETDGYTYRLPFGFGRALDLWYPGLWLVKDSQYGVSRCSHEFTVRTCNGVC